MKLPNGYGSVYKLSGKRRKPWAARKTVGWTMDEVNKKSYPVYKFIGYYSTRQEALTALAEYNKDPYDLRYDSLTFADVYEKWSNIHFPKVSQSTINASVAAFKSCAEIHDMRFVDIKLDHLQQVVDDSGKNTPSLKKIKILFGLMYDYAVVHEIVSQDKRDMVRYVDISGAGNPNAYTRKPFSKEQIDKLWEHSAEDYVSVILILIYTGLRIGELLDLKKEDIHLKERWLYIRKSKTESGIREVPIAEKLLPFFERWFEKDCEYFICSPSGKHLSYRGYYDTYWKPLMEYLEIDHRPHDTRHTCISLLTEADVNARIIKQIVGHKGQNVTEAVYTHISLKVKLDAINRI